MLIRKKRFQWIALYLLFFIYRQISIAYVYFYFPDKHEDGGIPILPRGKHNYPFEFKLPETALPCSFESKIGQIRYYLRIVMDIPYASPPQGIKYFTIIGPHLDCMEDKYLVCF